MKITELYEGAEPKLPGAVNGVKVMTPQQFAGQADEEEVDEGENWSKYNHKRVGGMSKKSVSSYRRSHPGSKIQTAVTTKPSKLKKGSKSAKRRASFCARMRGMKKHRTGAKTARDPNSNINKSLRRWHCESIEELQQLVMIAEQKINEAKNLAQQAAIAVNMKKNHKKPKNKSISEATALPADQRELSGQEFQDYMNRIKGTDDIDKKTGQVKVDKKGIPKYTTGKTKTDKYKMPYMHRSSVIEYYDEAGKRFKEDAVINALKTRPKKLLKQNEKMKHSNGDLEQFFNVGFAALTGVAVDESTGKLVIVNTCPGAGSCKIDCFAMKGGKVQFKAAWLSDGRILTFLLNDPTGFFDTLSSEISKEESLGQKGGYNVTIRWHDAGDFFSPEYLDMALKMAQKHPKVKFYAYTKMAGAALAQKPSNFIINWSEGANTSQEKQIKQNDPNLDKTKNSRIVPEKLFYDLLKKDAKGNLDKGPDGQWQVADSEKLQQLKDRLAQAYNISTNSILSYDEYMSKPKVGGMKYNVIVAPGEGDVSANDQNVLSTLLLRH
jgi:hypothetical protein